MTVDQAIVQGHTPNTHTDYPDCLLIHMARKTDALFSVSRGLPAASPAREKQSAADEVLVRKQFEKDPYACAETLLGKRKTRDPFVVGKGSYDTSNPDLAALFSWCDEKTFDGDLPW